MKKSNKLSTIKDLSLKIKSDPHSQILKIERGFIYLKKKKYKKAIDDFSIIIRIHDHVTIRGTTPNRYYSLNKNLLHKIYLFRGFAYALLDDRQRSCKDYCYLLDSNCNMVYPRFIFFLWAVLDRDNEQAIRRYDSFRGYSKELLEFEEDLFNLLPIDNIEGLNESIKLIDLSLGIIRKNRS